MNPNRRDDELETWKFCRRRPRSRSRARDFLEWRLGHAGLPSRITQLEPVAGWIEEIKLSSGEQTLRPIVEPVDGNLLFVKNLARLHQRLRTHRERMVHVMILDE